MAYYKINLDRLDDLYDEYVNLITVYNSIIEELEQNQGAVILKDAAAGDDIDNLIDKWMFKLDQEMPCTDELLASAKNYIDGLRIAYRARKLECCDFIKAFGEINEYSSSQMNGDVTCDTDIIDGLKEICESITTNLQSLADVLDNINDDWSCVNNTNDNVSSALESFSQEREKVHKAIEGHKEDLVNYVERVVNVDDTYKDFMKNRLPQYILLYETPDGLVMPDDLDITTFDNTSAIVDNLLRLSSVDHWDPTIKTKVMKDTDILIEHGKKDEILYVVNQIGDGNWNSYQGYVMSRLFVYGTDIYSDDVCNAIINNMIVNSTDETGTINTQLSEIKTSYFVDNIDPNTEGTAYYSIQRFRNVILIGDDISFTVCRDENGDRVLLIGSEYDLNGNKLSGKKEISLSFIDMNELIGDKGRDNLKNKMRFTDDEYIKYLSSVCSDEDVLMVCKLACIEKGDADAYLEYFNTDPRGLTRVFSSALSDYMLHLGDYGSEDYLNNLEAFTTALCNGKSIVFIGAYQENVAGIPYIGSAHPAGECSSRIYLDILQADLELKREIAIENCWNEYSSDVYTNYERISTMHTFISSLKYMQNESVDNIMLPDDHIEIKLPSKLTSEDCFEYSFIRNTTFNSGDNQITIYGCNGDDNLDDCKNLQENKNYIWDKKMVIAKGFWNGGKAGLYLCNTNLGSAVDFTESAVIDGEINIGSPQWTKETSINLSGAYVDVDGKSLIVANGTFVEKSATNKRVNTVLKIGAVGINTMIERQKIIDDWEEEKKNDWIDVYGSRAGFKISGSYDMNILNSDAMYVVTSADSCSPEGKYLGDAIGNGLVAYSLSPETIDYIEENLKYKYDPNSEDYNNIHGMIFGGYNPVEELGDDESEKIKYDEYVACIDDLISLGDESDPSYKQICEDYIRKMNQEVHN